MTKEQKERLFDKAWWRNVPKAVAWCNSFLEPFLDEDPRFRNDPEVFNSLGIIFYNKPDGTILPAGFTALVDDHFVFQYHQSYLDNPQAPPISSTLPKQEASFVSKQGEMLPFFDNMPAEGWFGTAQSAALGDTNADHVIRGISDKLEREPLANRYKRFMMFGRDYPGAVWCIYSGIDPQLVEQKHKQLSEEALRSRSSISGMQPKLLGVQEEDGAIRPAKYWEESTHIVKLPSETMRGLIEYEYMSIKATKKLLPEDCSVDAKLSDLILPNGETENVLAIKRFDRTAEGNKLQFEEMNQLLGRSNEERYIGAYSDIANVIREKVGAAGVKKFYARLLTQFLLGNTDNHMKNFGLIKNIEDGTWTMAPDYDLAPTINYGKRALALYATPHRHLGNPHSEGEEIYDNLNPKVLVLLGESFGLGLNDIKEVVDGIRSHIPEAKQAIMEDPCDRLDRKVGDIGRKNGSKDDRMRDDFCARIDGRQQQLFSTMDKYIQIQTSKASRRAGF